MDLNIRPAGVFDLPQMLSVDTVVGTDPSRKQLISHWLRNDTVLAAESDNRIVGYVVVNNGFFHHTQVEMLMVAEDARGRGIGQRLIREVEAVVHSSRLFITTNQSNNRMQRLLLRAGYRVCGLVDELDPGDPELVFFKEMG